MYSVSYLLVKEVFGNGSPTGTLKPDNLYNANGSVARLDVGNGVSTLYGNYGLSGNPWDVKPSSGLASYGRLWRARIEASSGAVLQDWRYTYDDVGNVTHIHDVPRSIGGPFTPTFTDPFNTGTSAWVTGTNVTIPYNYSGNNVAKLWGTGTGWTNVSIAACMR